MTDSATPSPNDFLTQYERIAREARAFRFNLNSGTHPDCAPIPEDSPIIGPPGFGKSFLRTPENACADQAYRMSAAMSPSFRDNFTVRLSLAGVSSAAELMWNPPATDPAGSNETRSR
ncbi:hypothetical protein [Rhodococcus sp. BH5]|uniref:hypothetical protein n=1 Tax=Rhodococcus sp. BH5 TaxID=2871702 RepID=UPI0022CD793D|nr:hypothetical protein [Rhodococcus sp. BH5]MCZ9635024.1 hypothetical protein [Rhodococcus sp. BH5]